jgi:hypothetical protein
MGKYSMSLHMFHLKTNQQNLVGAHKFRLYPYNTTHTLH